MREAGAAVAGHRLGDVRAQPLADPGHMAAGGGRSHQGQHDQRRHPEPEQHPQHGPGERPHRAVGGRQRGLVGQQRAQDDRRAGLHDVEDERDEPAPDRVPHRRRDVDERPRARDAERGGPHHRVDGAARRRPGQRRADDAERRHAHRRDRPGQALGEGGVEVHAQPGPLRRWHRVERRDRAGLGQPQRARAVERPLDVLRRPEVRLHPAAQVDERPHLTVVEARRPVRDRG